MVHRGGDDESEAGSDAMREPRFIRFWERYDVARLTSFEPGNGGTR
jgi:hypothetical protein